jgi:hypothetical protein
MSLRYHISQHLRTPFAFLSSFQICGFQSHLQTSRHSFDEEEVVRDAQAQHVHI